MNVSPNRIAVTMAGAFFALLLGAGAARAQGAPSATAARAVHRDTADSDLKIDDARRALEQAAAQADFASDARETALLQRAHDDLSAAVDQLRGSGRQRTVDLLADLDQAMQRTAASLGKFTSPDAQGFGPRVPSRQLLNGLATEALELQRNAPEVQRLPDTIVIGTGQPRSAAPAAGPLTRGPIALADQEPLSWPLGFQAAWPQIRIRF